MVCVRLKLMVSNQGGEALRIKEAILIMGQTIVVVDAKTNKKVARLLSNLSSIESKEQMCHVVFTSHERFLLTEGLKIVEKQFTSYGFVRINISTLVNRSFIKAFRSTDNARVEIEMQNGSKLL